MTLGDIQATPADHPAEYFDLTGRRVANPIPGQFYILRQGPDTRKIIY